MQFNQKFVDLSSPRIMGILNVTPDSFSDGGRYNHLDAALQQVEFMITAGADFIDVGGESTRPGAELVSLQQELDRVIPVIQRITKEFDTVVSVDTSKAIVMEEAVKAGAGLINDVRALREPNALQIAAEANVPVCLMHMQGQPQVMQDNPSYSHVVNEVEDFLKERIQQCFNAGITQDKIIVDPGFGFGKSMEHNYQLLAELDKLAELDVPILSGTSRKSMLGHLLNRDVSERLAGSLATAILAAQMGASILRVHDVKETADAIKITTLVNAYRNKS